MPANKRLPVKHEFPYAAVALRTLEPRTLPSIIAGAVNDSYRVSEVLTIGCIVKDHLVIRNTEADISSWASIPRPGQCSGVPIQEQTLLFKVTNIDGAA